MEIVEETILKAVRESCNIGGRALLTTVGIKWISEKTPITKTDVDKQRFEFWETICVYGGKPEIWLGLKNAIESENLETAQSIVDSLGIILVDGTLMEVYDSTGFKYVLPLYCLSYPENIEDSPKTTVLSSKSREEFQQHSFDSEKPVVLKLRISNGTDCTVNTSSLSSVTIEGLKLRVQEETGINKQNLAVFYLGKGPYADDTLLHKMGFDPVNSVLQIMVLENKAWL